MAGAFGNIAGTDPRSILGSGLGTRSVGGLGQGGQQGQQGVDPQELQKALLLLALLQQQGGVNLTGGRIPQDPLTAGTRTQIPASGVVTAGGTPFKPSKLSRAGQNAQAVGDLFANIEAAQRQRQFQEALEGLLGRVTGTQGGGTQSP